MKTNNPNNIGQVQSRSNCLPSLGVEASYHKKLIHKYQNINIKEHQNINIKEQILRNYQNVQAEVVTTIITKVTRINNLT